MILYIVQDWIDVNKGLLKRNNYLLVLIYNLVMVFGFPFSILPAFFEWLDKTKKTY